MQITDLGYPLMQFLRGDPQKMTGVRVRKESVGATDTLSLSAVPDKAIIEYLQTINDITSDLMRIIDGYAKPGNAGDIPVIPDQLPQDKAVSNPGMFIYFPSSNSGEENAEPGQMIVVQNSLSFSEAGLPELQDEQAVSDLVKETVRELSVVSKGIGLENANIESMPVREKFIIFTGTKDDTPVFSVIRQDPSGRSELLSQDQIEGEGISDIVTKLNTVITAIEPFDAPQPEKALPGAIKTVGVDPDNPPVSDDSEAGVPFNPVEIAKEILSSVFSKLTEANIKKEVVDQETAMADAPYGLVSSNNVLTDNIPGVVIRYIGSLAPAADIPDNNSTDFLNSPDSAITDKLISLEKSLRETLKFIVPPEGLPEEEDIAATEKIRASIREQMPVMVRDALETAKRNFQSAYPGGNFDKFGIDIDEKGMLKIDRAALAESLSEKKDETVRYIQDFGTSFQDKIRYDFNPLAGLFTSGESTASIIETRKKGGAGDEDDEQKTTFEKRLNEVQMLLESSYELKELFMQNISFDEPGPVDETD